MESVIVDGPWKQEEYWAFTLRRIGQDMEMEFLITLVKYNWEYGQ